MKRQYATIRQRYVYVVECVKRELGAYSEPIISKRYFSNAAKANAFAFDLALDLAGKNEQGDIDLRIDEQGNMTEYHYCHLSQSKNDVAYNGTVTVTREVVE